MLQNVHYVPLQSFSLLEYLDFYENLTQQKFCTVRYIIVRIPTVYYKKHTLNLLRALLKHV